MATAESSGETALAAGPKGNVLKNSGKITSFYSPQEILFCKLADTPVPGAAGMLSASDLRDPDGNSLLSDILGLSPRQSSSSDLSPETAVKTYQVTLSKFPRASDFLKYVRTEILQF